MDISSWYKIPLGALNLLLLSLQLGDLTYGYTVVIEWLNIRTHVQS